MYPSSSPLNPDFWNLPRTDIQFAGTSPKITLSEFDKHPQVKVVPRFRISGGSIEPLASSELRSIWIGDSEEFGGLRYVMGRHASFAPFKVHRNGSMPVHSSWRTKPYDPPPYVYGPYIPPLAHPITLSYPKWSTMGEFRFGSIGRKQVYYSDIRRDSGYIFSICDDKVEAYFADNSWNPYPVPNKWSKIAIDEDGCYSLLNISYIYNFWSIRPAGWDYLVFVLAEGDPVTIYWPDSYIRAEYVDWQAW
jgi:hypothetical protein